MNNKFLDSKIFYKLFDLENIAIRKIVIFVGTPFTKRDYERFGGEILRENGFEVWFYDFSPVLYPKLFTNCVYPDLYQPKNYVRFLDECQIKKQIEELTPDTFIVTTLIYGSDTHKIYKSLSKTKIPYCLLPQSTFPIGNRKFNSKFISLVKKIFKFRMDSVKNILYKPKFSKFWGIRPPEFCIIANENSLRSNKAKGLIGARTKILWAHSLDYNTFLKNNKNNNKVFRNHAVFLDSQAPLFPGDSLAMGFKHPLTVEKYFPSICRFFDFVEKQLNIKVKIAAHPKSNHPTYPDYYGNRETLSGATFGMIKNSSLVISQGSTAIQFAILLKKPIFFLTTNELEKDPIFSSDIKAFANSLGKEPINIDEPFFVDWEKELLVDEKVYDEYINIYIKKRGTEELNTWQILANQLKAM